MIQLRITKSHYKQSITYSVSLSADTTISDAGDTFINTATMTISIGSLNQNISASANASIAICIHGSSLITLANKQVIEISKIKPGELIMGADGIVTPIVEAVPCWLGINNKVLEIV